MDSKVLVVDDDPVIRKTLSQYLQREGYACLAVGTGAETILTLEQSEFQVVLLDLRMPDTGGLELLSELKMRWPDLCVILMTAYATIEVAIEAVKKGAFDFLTKPFANLEVVLLGVQRALKQSDTTKKLAIAQNHIDSQFRFENLIGHSELMQKVFKTIADVAYSNSTVVVRGESGTGKELVARAIHLNSPRKKNVFMTCNCGALTESILDSELFGHVRGAFTGAVSDKKGLFEAANGGTLFLDEIGEMPLATQVKLLRALQEGEIKRLGDNRNIKVDVRVIAATHRQLEDMISEKSFREDLYYRLKRHHRRSAAAQESNRGYRAAGASFC